MTERNIVPVKYLVFVSETTLIKDKLEQLGSWQLFGNIACMKTIRLIGADRDSLLLSFQEAKVLFLKCYSIAVARGFIYIFFKF